MIRPAEAQYRQESGVTRPDLDVADKFSVFVVKTMPLTGSRGYTVARCIPIRRLGILTEFWMRSGFPRGKNEVSNSVPA